jgi:outer membrane autotransporter protein
MADVTADVGSEAGTVRIETQSFGGYWTHFGADGWYLDGLAQLNWLDATLVSPRMETVTSGTGLAASLEGGYPVALGSRVVLEPQAQLTYQRTAFDAMADELTTVSFEDASSVTARLGARLSRAWGGQSATQPEPRSTTWGRVSVGKAFDEVSRIRVSTTTLETNLGQAWLDLGLGGDVRVRGAVTLYGTGSYQTALSGDRSAFTVNGGLRVSW